MLGSYNLLKKLQYERISCINGLTVTPFVSSSRTFEIKKIVSFAGARILLAHEI